MASIMTATVFIDDKGSSRGKERGDQGTLVGVRKVATEVTGHDLCQFRIPDSGKFVSSIPVRLVTYSSNTTLALKHAIGICRQ